MQKALLLVLVGVVGCGNVTPPGEDNTPVDMTPLTTAVAVCNDAYGALYQKFADCSSGGFTVSDFLKRTNLDICLRYGALVDSGTVKFDPSKAASCRSTITSTACDTIFSTSASLLASCNDIFSGTKTAGMPCTTSVECASHLCANDSACPGSCVAPAEAGVACTDSSFCKAGLVCNSLRKCAAAAADGGACMNDADCAPGSHCTSAKCKKPVASGPCTDDRDCASFLFCDGAGTGKGMCARLRKVNEACARTEDCVSNLGCRDGQCQPLPGLGGSCGTVSKKETGCAQGYCDAKPMDVGTCKAFVAAGGACSMSLQQCDVGLTCGNDGKCARTVCF